MLGAVQVPEILIVVTFDSVDVVDPDLGLDCSVAVLDLAGFEVANLPCSLEEVVLIFFHCFCICYGVYLGSFELCCKGVD